MANDIMSRAKRYVKGRLQEYVAPIKKEPTYQTAFTSRRAGGSPFGITGEEEKAKEPASGVYEHNSPAKPL